MLIDVIETYSDFEKLKENWNKIYEKDPDAQFFLSWVFMSQLFSQQPKHWFILAVRPDDANSDYIAFFPLRLKTRRSGTHRIFYNELSVAGRFAWADYSGLICDPDFDADAIPKLASKLKRMHWREIALKNLHISDHRLDLFLEQFDPKIFSWKLRERSDHEDKINLLVCPYVALPDNFETYLQENLSANTRQKMRRFLRKLDQSDELKITHSIPETYDRDLDILINFWKEKWAKEKGNDVHHLAKTYRKILSNGLNSGTLILPVLWQGDRPLGALGSFIDRQKNTLLYFVAGRDESCNNPPPGLILHADSIRWAIGNGIKCYDFLRGDEHFKYSYGATDRPIRYLVLKTKSGKNINGRLDSRSIDEVMRRSTHYLNKGQLQKSKKGFQQVLEIAPENTTALRRYARSLYQNGEYEEARRSYLKLLELKPNQAEVWYGLGKSLLKMKKYKQAEATLKKSIQLNPAGKKNERYYLKQATLAKT